MLSSEGKHTDTTGTWHQMLTTAQTKWQQGGVKEQIFQLIDSLLSFEACLYHQVLPFGLEDNHLMLGMVYPQDTAALDYVQGILSYMNFTMVPEVITADVHRTVLSAYLNYKNTSAPNQKKPLADEVKNEEISSQETIKHIIDYSESNYQSIEQVEKQQPPAPEADLPSDIELNHASTTNNLLNALNVSIKPNLSPEEVSTEKVQILPVQIPEQFSPVEVLATLPPKKLLEELLGRVLVGGIGRLYWERQPDEGRILWSDNGVLQSVVDKLSLSVFEGVLNELKQFTGMPLISITEPRQIEKECLYQKNRLLLRLRIMPGVYGEEATLQVLRGAALKFYQQQQLTHLSRDTLGVTKQLSFMLHEMQERLTLNTYHNPQQLEALTTLNQLVDNLDQQIKILTDYNYLPGNGK